MNNQIEELLKMIKGMFISIGTVMVSYLVPIHDYLTVILIFCSVNLFLGVVADQMDWSFKKAFKSFKYLLGYMSLLILFLVAGRLMRMEELKIQEYLSWVTWFMLYFYATNIFRNWHKAQPDNRVIAFLYWIFSFKIRDNVKLLKEYKDHKETNKDE